MKRNYIVSFRGETTPVVLQEAWVEAFGASYPYESSRTGPDFLRIRVNNKVFVLQARVLDESRIRVSLGHQSFDVEVRDEGDLLIQQITGSASQALTELTVRSPMPGLVKVVEVTEGEIVNVNQGLLILEAMKMENEIRSPVSGKIRKIIVSQGAAVDKGEVLLIIDSIP